jgi:putative tryptophan/tyrosine transport system substrate-binding protein
VKRREFIALLLGAAAAWPLAARAQQATSPVIGFIGVTSHDEWRDYVAAFYRGLNDTGYVEGRNVTMEYRWAEGRYDRLPAMASDLVGRKADVIVAIAPPAALAAKAATRTIPIVFFMGSDPVELGLVASLSRPGGNVTGVTALANAVSAKRLQMLREVVPAAATNAMLVNPTNQNANRDVNEMQAAAAGPAAHRGKGEHRCGYRRRVCGVPATKCRCVGGQSRSIPAGPARSHRRVGHALPCGDDLSHP